MNKSLLYTPSCVLCSQKAELCKQEINWRFNCSVQIHLHGVKCIFTVHMGPSAAAVCVFQVMRISVRSRVSGSGSFENDHHCYLRSIMTERWGHMHYKESLLSHNGWGQCPLCAEGKQGLWQHKLWQHNWKWEPGGNPDMRAPWDIKRPSSPLSRNLSKRMEAGEWQRPSSPKHSLYLWTFQNCSFT